MRGTIATACVLAMMSVGVGARQSPPQSPPVKKVDVAKKAKKKIGESRAPAQQVTSQSMPPMPATLMNSQPVTPRVTMESGLLTIDAPNSVLSEVLNGVHTATGATIEGATPSERVAVKLGPGNPEQVIAALLRGTAYDYVILGSLGRQDVVTRVLLTQQSSAAPQGGGQPAQNTSRQQEIKQPQPTDETMPDRTVPDDAASQPNPENNEPDQALQQQQQQQPPPQPGQPQDPNQPKTPEQLFRELQQLEQQKQPPK